LRSEADLCDDLCNVGVKFEGDHEPLSMLRRPPGFIPAAEMNLLQLADLAAFIVRDMTGYNDKLGFGRFVLPALVRNGFLKNVGNYTGVITYP
jgi:hypothetical protein